MRHDLAAIMWETAIVMNVISAFLILYLMQAVTHGAGFHCPMALLRFVQRLALAVLSGFMMVNAANIYTTGEIPRPMDFWIEFVFTLCCIMSSVRHVSAPPIPAENNWSQVRRALHL